MNEKQEKTLNIAKEHAKSKGGSCLSNEYLNAKTKLEWKCDNPNHPNWFSSCDKVLGKEKTWCPQCGYEKMAESHKNKNGLNIAKEYAKQKNGECLSSHYTNNSTKLEWKCSNPEHPSWFATYASVIQNNSWCPICGTHYYKEEKIRTILEYLLETKFVKCKPVWNINPKTNSPLELDGFSEDKKIAFEFQGRHHYEENVFINSKDNLEYIQYKDNIKKDNCLKNNILLIIIDDDRKLKSFDDIYSYLISLLNKMKINTRKNIDINKVKELFEKMDEYHKKYLKKAQDYAKSRNGSCLSNAYVNSDSKMEWKCDNPEHPSWFAPYPGIASKKTWCNLCGKISSSEKQKSKTALTEAKKYAKQQGGKCLSKEYIKASKHLEWKCDNPAHPSWFASFNNVVGKTWCKLCSFEKTREKNKNIDGLLIAQNYALKHGGKCLSKEYLSSRENLEWKCSNYEHSSWFATYDSVINNNTWCPQCGYEKVGFNNKNKDGLLIAQNHAKNKSGLLLSEEYKNSKQKLIWKCSNPNHPVWEASYESVLLLETWCPKCAGKFTKKEGLENAQKHAISKGGHCLSNEYINNSSKLLWKCNNLSHLPWEANYANVVNKNSWCPECSKEKRSKTK